ncbi:hypothetical protein ACXJY6_18730 [Vibrio sp. RC27]
MNEKLKDYIFGNLASVFWTAFLVIGGGVFIFFYASIGYMPDFDFKSSVTILSAVSITTIVTIIALATILIMPGVMWTKLWADNSKIRSNWEDGESKQSFIKTLLWLGAPILFFFGLLLIITSDKWQWWYAIPYVLSGLVISYFIIRKLSELKNKTIFFELVKMWFTSLICSLLAIYPLLLILKLLSTEVVVKDATYYILGFTVIFIIALINVIATVPPKNTNKLGYYLGLGTSSLIIIFAVFGAFGKIPTQVMKAYKLGSIDTESVIFKSEACGTLELLDVSIIRKKFQLPEQPKLSKQCLVKNVKILSRLGSDMYLEIGDLKIAIKSSEILSWSIKEGSK